MRRRFGYGWGNWVMRCDWRELTFGDVCSSVSETYRGIDSEVILVNTSDVLKGKILNYQSTENKNLRGQFKKTFKRDDILFSEIRPINKRYAYVDFADTQKYIASTRLMILRANTELIMPRYLYYLLTSDKVLAELQHLAETRSGTFPQITFLSEIAPMEISIPPLDVQEKIAAILSSLDDKIDLNRRINENLERQSMAIFRHEFLSFDVMPEGWRKGSLIEIADYLNGLPMQKYRPENEYSSLPVLKIKELRQGFCASDSDLCSSSISPEYIIHDGDVIFSWSGSLLVDFWCGGLCGLNQHLFKVTSGKYDKWFYYSWTKYYLSKFAKIAADMATTMGHIKRGELAKTEVLIPPESDYKSIGAILSPIYEQIISNRLQNKKLAQIRDALLPKLISGEITP